MTLLFACIALVLAAQDGIPVNFEGDKPTISDFAWAFLSFTGDDEEEECCMDESTNAFKEAWIRYREGVPQPEGETLSVDQKNGFILYESRYEEHLLRIEMCYWNESDKKHKLLAYCISGYFNDVYSPGQFDGLSFFRYDNATKTMTGCDAPGFEVEYWLSDGVYVSYDLPRSGKDITVNYWYGDRQEQKTLKWNGRRFSL